MQLQPRLKNPAILLPDTMQAFFALISTLEKSELSATIRGLTHLRVSQINGCSVCLEFGWRQLKKDGETDERLFSVAAWRETPYFTDAERAALALAEAVTRIADSPDPVSDEVWNEAARHFDERELAALTFSIALANTFNRLNRTTRQIAGDWIKSASAKEWMDNHAMAS